MLVEVPDVAHDREDMTNDYLKNGLYGSLFHDPQVAAEFSGAATLGHMLAFQRAWTRALVQAGAVTGAAGADALRALDAFVPERFQPASDIDGLPVPSLVAQLRAGLPPEVAQAIHSGATSQDVVDTAQVLALLAVLDLFVARLDRLDVALAQLHDRFGPAPLTARTRMQAALPATASLRIAGWWRGLLVQAQRAPSVRADLAQVQIGGAIGTRDLPQGVAQAVADSLGLALTPVWHTERSSMVTFGHWLTLVAGALGKIGQDVALMAQQGVGTVTLSGGGGSSAMPHKQNPVLAEVIVALARHVAGLQGTLAHAMLHEQERSGAAWALEWLTLPAMAEATGAALRHADELLAAIQAMGDPA
jgi:3-carboxy-cis,cis-muconate cycloisomerase